jgi:hypothetical protein
VTAQPPYQGYPAPSNPAPTPAPAATPSADKDARKVVEPYREWGALALLAVTAIVIFFGLIDWLLHTDSFESWVDSSFGDFVGLATIFFPLVAVFLATVVKPVTPRAKLIVIGALVIYGVAALFGLLSALIGFIHQIGLDGFPIGDAFLNLISRLVWLALLGFAAFVVFRVFAVCYQVPRPVQAPAGYGYPGYQQQGYPAGYPAGYGQPGATGYQQQGYPAGYPTSAGQQAPTSGAAYPTSGAAGYPTSGAAGYAAPTSGAAGYQPGYPTGAPQSGYAAPQAPAGQPGYPQPGGGQHSTPESPYPPAAPAAGNEHTQVIPPAAGQESGSEHRDNGNA